MNFQPLPDSFAVLKSRIEYFRGFPSSKMILGSYNTDAFSRLGGEVSSSVAEALGLVERGYSTVLSLAEHDWSSVSPVTWMTVLPHIDSSQYQRSPVALVVAADRFRAVALASEFISIDPYLSGVSLLVDGGHYPSQLRELDRYGQVVIGTIERLLEMAKKRELNLGHLRCLVFEGTQNNIAKLGELCRYVSTSPQLLLHTVEALPIEKKFVESHGKFATVKVIGDINLVERTPQKTSGQKNGRDRRAGQREDAGSRSTASGNEKADSPRASSEDEKDNNLRSQRSENRRNRTDRKPDGREERRGRDRQQDNRTPAPEFAPREVIPDFEMTELDFGKVDHKVLKVKGSEVTAKPASLIELLRREGGRSVVFCDNPGELNLLKGYLGRNDFEPVIIDADMPIRVRNDAASKFLQSSNSVLIVTDLGVRGLNVAGADLIVNYAIPERSEFYMSRIKAGARRDGKCTVITVWSMIEALKLASLKDQLEFDLQEV